MYIYKKYHKITYIHNRFPYELVDWTIDRNAPTPRFHFDVTALADIQGHRNGREPHLEAPEWIEIRMVNSIHGLPCPAMGVSGNPITWNHSEILGWLSIFRLQALQVPLNNCMAMDNHSTKRNENMMESYDWLTGCPGFSFHIFLELIPQ